MDLRNPDLLRDKAYINGKWVNALDGKSFQVKNPYDNSIIGNVPDMSAGDTKLAITAAEKAQKTWSSYTSGERASILKRWHELLLLHVKDLAFILTAEQGKPIQEAIGEIRYGAAFVEWFAEEARRIYGDVIPSHSKDKRLITLKQPIGVVAAITPWNFPNAMITRKIAPALAAGCTVVIKPAEDTPLSALAIGVLAEQAGFPQGTINIITTNDPAPVGNELTANPIVRKLSFTGSTKVGKLLMSQCGNTVKKVSLELGGNAPFIVFKDADIDAAVSGAIAAKFRNTGQTCVCANRFYVQEDIYTAFSEKMTEAIKQQKIGSGFLETTQIGPLINDAAVNKVERLVNDALLKGAATKIGGSRMDLGSGNFYAPTVLTNLTPEMTINHEEIFGPVAPIFSFKTEEEAVALANNTNYGLAAYFYGRDYAMIWRVAEALEYGMVGINTGRLSTPLAPFGGIKESGIGREGSKYGIDEYLEIKYLCFGGIE
ncbi:MAG: NAD-dependent succinate-semialdehyde dehydrogenase [Bacteroidota bacterium]